MNEEQQAVETAADNCEVLRARLAKYEDAEGRPLRSDLRYTSDGELAECPCCGSLDVGGANGTVSCYGCDLQITKPRPLQNAADAWNKRAALKAQPSGVVQWPDADEIMQMAFEEGQPSEDASGYYFELEEFDLFIQRLMEEVARLNSSPVSDGDPCMCGGNPHTTQCLYEHFLSYSGLADQPTLRYAYFHGAGFAAEIDQPSAGGVDERALYEQSCKERAASNGRVYEAHYFKRPAGVGEYLNPGAEHGWQVWQQARAALSANHSEQVREVNYKRKFEYLVEHAKRQDRVIAEMRYDENIRRFYDDGAVWFWAGDETDNLETLACPVVINAGDLRALLAAAPSAGSQGGDV